MAATIKGIKKVSGTTWDISPEFRPGWKMAVWYNPKENSVIAIFAHIQADGTVTPREGYILLKLTRKHVTMKEIRQRVSDYWALRELWEEGL